MFTQQSYLLQISDNLNKEKEMFTPTNLKANWLELQRAHAVACLAQRLARHNHFLMLSFFGNGFWLYAAISQSFHIKLILLRFICLLFLLTRTNYVAPPTHSWRLFYYCAKSCATHTPKNFWRAPLDNPPLYDIIFYI